GRIIGGREVKPHSRPYMAHLQIKKETGSSTCGGFLIRPDAVLSAAHCVDEGTKGITVTLGAHDIRKKGPTQQNFAVRHWVIHPNYSHRGFQNDIMLLKLKPKANITEYVKTIPFARRNERLQPGTKCDVAGWGLTSLRGHKTDVLMEVELKVQNAEECEQGFPNYQCQSMLCVGDKYDEKASYCGDSGGPLVCNRKAHGIVSHGGTYNPLPQVFTRISYFEPWIHEQLRR
ncbi:CATG protein, partial [Ptilonorhynchus violaceus]|nr:CATG protein [Ptilonorhynchus violaceus]